MDDPKPCPFYFEDNGLIQHEWELSEKTTPSGKVLWECKRCGLSDPAPVKPEYERTKCNCDQKRGR
jgi:hypothetical protein